MYQPIRWGILGCGSMANKFIDDLHLVENATIQAIASRSQERANHLGKIHGVDSCYGSYEQLVKDENVDIIYIATRNPQHVPNSLLALQHNKHVLCEKPMAMNLPDAKQVIAEANRRNLFFMEGLWTRFFPMTKLLKHLITKKKIGDITLIQADFGFFVNPNDPNKVRLFSNKLGGGSLLDIGIYPLFISLLALGMPQSVKATANVSNGVDLSCAMVLNYSSGALANLSSTFQAYTPGEAWFHGSQGSLKLHRMFHEAAQLSLYKRGIHVNTWEEEKKGRGYIYEIEHVHQCLQERRTESPLMSHQDSLDLMRLMDWVKTEINLVFSV